jgi:nucleoid-associated protein
MSAVIHNFVVHQFVIDQQQTLSLIAKQSGFEITPAIEDFAEQLNHAFNSKPGKGVGGFVTAPEADTDSETEDGDKLVAAVQFRPMLENLIKNPDNFVDFSVKSCELLKKTLVDFATIETGFVIFSHYEFLATEYLMITLLNTKEHVEINRALELNRSHHVDLAKMQLAVRIDLTQLRINAEHNRYISFIKGRMGRKVSDFFMAFIGCEELVDVKQQNKQLLVVVDNYLAAEQLDPNEKLQNRTIVSDYYKHKLEQGEDIQIKELAEKLPKDGSHGDFYQFNQSSDVPLEDNFQADRGALKTLAKFTGQGGGISLSFERKLLGDRIAYHADTDTLVIKGIPPNLKDQLLKS